MSGRLFRAAAAALPLAAPLASPPRPAQGPPGGEAVEVLALGDGRPLEGVELRLISTGGRYSTARTGASGRALLEPVGWPADLYAVCKGWDVIGRRVGERLSPLAPGLRLAAAPGRIELVLSRRGRVEVRVVDARSGLALEHATVRVRYRDAASGADVRRDLFGGGAGWYTLDAPRAPGRLDPPFDSAEIAVEAAGYESPAPLERPWDPELPGVRAEVRLAPAAGALRLRARLVAPGRGLAGERVGVSLLRHAPLGAAFEEVWHGHSGPEGRFEAVVLPPDPRDLVIAHTESRGVPIYWAGPVPAQDAAAGELTVAVESWPLVQAVVRGLEPGIEYAYFVWLEVGGARFELFSRPIEPAADGEAVRAVLALPPGKRLGPGVRARVAVGPAREGVRGPHGRIEPWDGTQPEPLELVAYDLLTVAGHVVAPASGELRGASVFLRPEGGERALWAFPDSSGRFELRGLPPGRYTAGAARGAAPGPGPRAPAGRLLDLRQDVRDLELRLPEG